MSLPVRDLASCALAGVVSVGALAIACQGRETVSSGVVGSAAAAPVAKIAIELRSAEGTVTATVIPGQPCRATVEGVEVIVGGRPLVAQLGTTRWDGEDTDNGTTLKRNDHPLARIHARQLFDEQGAPIVRVSDDGSIHNAAGQIVRKASVDGTSVRVEKAVNPGQPAADVFFITNTNDLVLAAMLSARETTAEIRALAACHFLLPDALPASPSPAQ